MSDTYIPPNVEFQLQLDVMVAVLKRDLSLDTGYVSGATSYIRPNGNPVYPPPEDFFYAPSELVDVKPFGTPAIYVGWAVRAVASVLHDYGLTTNWSIARGEVVDYAPVSEAELDHEAIWAVCMATDKIREFQEPEYDYVGVRITSPVFDHTRQHDFDFQLKQALGALSERLITFAPSNSRLTVLVRPANTGFSLVQLRNLACLLWIADPLLAEVHPPHCGPGSLASLGLQYTHLARHHDFIDMGVQVTSADSVQDPWDYRLSADRIPLVVLKNPGVLSEPQFRHGIKTIKNAENVSDLLDLLEIVPVEFEEKFLLKVAGPRGSAYDFTQLYESFDTAHGMFAFNQHYGTLKFDAITNWTTLCVNLVALSLNEPFFLNSWLKLLDSRIQAHETSLFDALRDIGLDATAEYYQKRKLEHLIADFEDWPILRKAIPDDDSQPMIASQLATLYDHGIINSQEQRMDEAIQMQLLAFIGGVTDKWHQPSRIQNPDSRFTWGIEIEMLNPVLGGDFRFAGHPTAVFAPFSSKSEDPQPSDPRRYASGSVSNRLTELIKTVEGFGVPARGDEPWDLNMDSMRRLKACHLRNSGLLATKGYKLEYSVWMVMNDASLTDFRDWKGYDRLSGVELASPVYRDKPECWESLLDVVCGLRRELRVAVDDSCGFHVSVGTGTELMSLDFLRKLACASFVADRLIFSLCHPRRTIGNNNYCASLRGDANISRWVRDEWRQLPVLTDFARHFALDELSVDECASLKKLWLAKDDYKLAEDLDHCNGGKGCVSYHRIIPAKPAERYPRYFTGAVEFRYLQGTLDPELILRFSQLMVAFFKFVETAEPQVFRSFSSNLLRCKDNWTYDLAILEQFLSDVGMGDDYTYWHTQVQQNRAMLPLIEEGKTWYATRYSNREVVEDLLDRVEIVPMVPDDLIETLRNEVCRRPKFAKYAMEELSDVSPKVTIIDANTDLLDRVRAILKNTRLSAPLTASSLQSVCTGSQIIDSITDTYLKRRLDHLTKSHRAIENKDAEVLAAGDLNRKCSQTYQKDGISALFEVLDEHRKSIKMSEGTKVSTTELNALACGDEAYDSDEIFIFADCTQVKGRISESNLPQHELDQFLGP